MLGPKYLLRRVAWRLRWGGKRQGIRRIQKFLGVEDAPHQRRGCLINLATAVAFAALIFIQLVWIGFWILILVACLYVMISLA